MYGSIGVDCVVDSQGRLLFLDQSLPRLIYNRPDLFIAAHTPVSRYLGSLLELLCTEIVYALLVSA